MRDMAHEFFVRSPYLLGPVIALALFIVIFGLVIVRVMARKPAELEALARMPLEADSQKVPHE